MCVRACVCEHVCATSVQVHKENRRGSWRSTVRYECGYELQSCARAARILCLAISRLLVPCFTIFQTAILDLAKQAAKYIKTELMARTLSTSTWAEDVMKSRMGYKHEGYVLNT